MTTLGQWVQGARPRTLPAAISPVLVGTGAAIGADGFRPVAALLALLTALALARRPLYRAALAAQLALVAAAAAGGRIRARPLLVARYYVLTTAAIAAGLYDQVRHGTPAGWEPAEGTR